MFRRTRLVIAAASVALLAGSGLAMAATDDADESEPGGTFFTYGYDPANHLLVTGIHPVEAVAPVDCTIAGTYDVGYAAAGDGDISVATVEDADGPATFPVESDGEDPGVPGIAYDDEGNPCTLEAIVVAGPNGQVNHGQVVSAFSRALDIAGKGCVMRWIAQSGFGKGDQQVNTPDVDPTFAPLDMGSVDLVTVMAACNQPAGDDEPEDEDAGAARPGKPDKADTVEKGKPESPGNSANAPGRNK
jgi:hypothetical protein